MVFGSCLYRFIVAVALRFNVPAAAMKLVSAIIVAIAISMPAIREKIAFEQRKHGPCPPPRDHRKEGLKMEMLQLNDLHKTFNPGTVNEKWP